MAFLACFASSLWSSVSSDQPAQLPAPATRGFLPTVAALRFPSFVRQSCRFLESTSLHPPQAALRRFPRKLSRLRTPQKRAHAFLYIGIWILFSKLCRTLRHSVQKKNHKKIVNPVRSPDGAQFTEPATNTSSFLLPPFLISVDHLYHTDLSKRFQCHGHCFLRRHLVPVVLNVDHDPYHLIILPAARPPLCVPPPRSSQTSCRFPWPCCQWCAAQ